MVFNLNLPEQERQIYAEAESNANLFAIAEAQQYFCRRQIYVIFITMGKLLFLYFGFIMNATWMQGKSSLP